MNKWANNGKRKSNRLTAKTKFSTESPYPIMKKKTPETVKSSSRLDPLLSSPAAIGAKSTRIGACGAKKGGGGGGDGNGPHLHTFRVILSAFYYISRRGVPVN